MPRAVRSSLVAAVAVAAGLPGTALGAGGASAPTSSGSAGAGTGGGAGFGTSMTPDERRRAGTRRPSRRRPARRRTRRRGPVLERFSVGRRRLFLYGRSSRVSFRIRGRGALRVRLSLARAGSRRAVKVVSLGLRRPGVTHRYALTGREDGVLPQGRYVVRISGRDRRGRRLRRAASASSSAPLRFFHHRFPVVGPHTFAGEGGRFGDSRPGRKHQGQDVSAPEGTPLVAPRGGRVETVAYQAEGAGHYVVLDGEGEDRDYVFMHMVTGSVAVRRGQRVRTGQRIGRLGNTGRSFGAHLHFEIWVGGWFAGGRPVDPLPLLRAWDAWS